MEVETELLHQLRDMVVTLLEKNTGLILTPRFRYQIVIFPDSAVAVAGNFKSSADNYLFGLAISTLLVNYLITKKVYGEISDSLFNSLFSLVSKIQIRSLGYRSWSLYNLFAHETQHAFEEMINQRQLQLLPLLQSLIWESQFYKDHKTLNLSAELFNLIEFYVMFLDKLNLFGDICFNPSGIS